MKLRAAKISLPVVLFSLILNFSAHAAPNPVPALNKVIWIWLENTPDQLLSGKKYAYYLWLNYPSVRFSKMMPTSSVTQANSFALIAGSDFGIKDNELVRVFQPTILNLLEKKSIPWRVYADQYAGSCDLSEGIGDYRRYRVPFLSISQVQTDRYLCSKVVGFRFMDDDLKYNTLPQFSFVIPSLKNSGATTNVSSAENTLRRVIDPIISNADLLAQTTIIITTTNNTDAKYPEVFSMILGNGVADYALLNEQPYNHYNLLRTIEEGFGLGTLNQNDSKSVPMTGFWK